MTDERASTDGPSRRRVVRLGGGMVAGVGMAWLAGCGLPGGGEEDDDGDDGDDGDGEDGEGDGDDD